MKIVKGLWSKGVVQGIALIAAFFLVLGACSSDDDGGGGVSSAVATERGFTQDQIEKNLAALGDSVLSKL